MIDPTLVGPQTDAGTDTVARFRYQAEVTMPFCLLCALDDDVVSIIPELHEDIAIEYKDRWRFIQVKSRNPEAEQWNLTALLKKKGGALRSLFRTYKQVSDVNATFELLLEGVPKSKDLILQLREEGDHADPKLVEKVSNALGQDKETVRTFLERVILLGPPAPRPVVEAVNLDLLHQQNSSVSRDAVCKIHTKILQEIERAMRAEPLGEKWPSYITNDTVQEKVAKIVNAKRLSKPMLSTIVEPILSSPRYLLQRITDPSSDSVSTIERKLITGGAPEDIVHQARKLQSNAQLKLITDRASSIDSEDAQLDDLHQRIEGHAVAKLALYNTDSRPAIKIWNDLLSQFSSHASTIDIDGLLDRDPMLLLGEACGLSDRCRFGWGISNED